MRTFSSRHRTVRRLILYIILFSSAITLISSALQLYLEYTQGVAEINAEIHQIKDSQLESIALNVQDRNIQLLQLQLDGLVKLPGIERISIVTTDRVKWRAGEVMSNEIIDERFVLYQHGREQEPPLGILQIVVGLDELYSRLTDRVYFIVISNGIKTFLVAGFILYLFQYLVTRHLSKISDFAQNLTFDKPIPPLVLDRDAKERNAPDELQTVVSALNGMQLRLGDELQRRQEAEQKLLASRDQIAHLDRLNSMGEMVSTITHEINQPLTAIASYAQSATRRIDNARPEQQAELQQWLATTLKKISEQALRSGKVLQRIRNFVKLRAMDMQRLDVNTMLREVSDMVETTANSNQVSLVLEFNPSPLYVEGDPVQLQQVSINLIKNAIEASHPGAQVVISTCLNSENNEVELCIHDEGVGVSGEDVEHLFEPFYTSKKQGMGVGLSISLAIAKAHNGTLKYQANAQGGCDFTLTLPAVGEEVAYDV
ncbi:sensor histidine kinase [Pseudoalteromonas sp. T1lg10]|uniref:sensor histidine kinase n=1 Tax=Pseudoalteromonas sp. T1lg10 TaxID=2077093 RepID=UPI000CF6F547|nr:ATP-binding protein [Pseudoalteromonas sp. T1lg10]